MNAACPPSFCASAMMCSVIVVLPPDSGPKTSMTRPRGKPPTPSAASIDRHPLGITLTGTRMSRLPSRMIAPLPWSFSICDIAAASNFSFSSVISHLGGGNWKLGLPAQSGPALYKRTCGADGLSSALGKRFAQLLVPCRARLLRRAAPEHQGRNEVWSLPLDSFLRHPYLPVSLKPPKATSPLTTVLRIVVPQPRLRRLLAFIQRHPFLVGQLPQPG